MAFTKNKSVVTPAPIVAATPAADTAIAAVNDRVATETAKAASGTGAAISRLKKADPAPAAKAYQPRDFDREARGKTRCVQFEAALMSPALAGAKWDTVEEFLALCQKAADYGTAYTFGDELPK